MSQNRKDNSARWPDRRTALLYTRPIHSSPVPSFGLLTYFGTVYTSNVPTFGLLTYCGTVYTSNVPSFGLLTYYGTVYTSTVPTFCLLIYCGTYTHPMYCHLTSWPTMVLKTRPTHSSSRPSFGLLTCYGRLLKVLHASCHCPSSSRGISNQQWTRAIPLNNNNQQWTFWALTLQ